MSVSRWPRVARKPRISPEVRRDEYMTTVVIRFRRPWKQMGAAERAAVLEDGAAFLESVAGQMRSELSEIEIG